MSNLIQPPEDWLNDVIKILRDGDPAKIDWTNRADQDWGQFGMKHEAYEHLIQSLSFSHVLVEPVEMQGAQETYAFLCPHPQGASKDLYAKVGLKDVRLRIKIFSLHVDLVGKLKQKIAKHLKKK